MILLLFLNGKNVSSISCKHNTSHANVHQEQIQIATGMAKAERYLLQILLIHFSPYQSSFLHRSNKSKRSRKRNKHKNATAWRNQGFPYLQLCNSILVSCIAISKPTPRVHYFQHVEKCSSKSVYIFVTAQLPIMIEKRHRFSGIVRSTLG